jgi:aryl-alcohol dehydrogenase-like predicted oxidoreductase
MRYRPLGRSGTLVSEIGFGTWGLGGTRGGSVAYGPTDDRQSLAALHRAFDLGVTFYDTADLYGQGHSEELLGEAFAHQRADVFLATKAGFLDGTKQDFSPRHIERALEGSLRRLRTSYLDLFLLHNPPRDALLEQPAVWRLLETLRECGKVRGIGVSVRSPDDGLALVDALAPDAIEVNFNLADQRAAEDGLFARCLDRGIGVIVRTPLCFGFLTGAYAESARFDAGDHRGRWSPEQRTRWHQAHEVFGECLTQERGQTPAQLALRFCLSHPGVSTVIPGMLSVTHVKENVRASDLGPLEAGDLERIARTYEGQTFFLGK